MKVALVHDWLTGLRGGERCLEVFLRMYPKADIFTLLHLPGTTNRTIDQRVKQTSFLQHVPSIGRHYRKFLLLYPRAVSSFKFDGYDLVISLSHAAAKNAHVPRHIPHICYCFTPMRYIWDRSRDYFGNLSPLVSPLVSGLRSWDVKGAEQVDHFAVISRFVAARVRKFYGRESTVIYPPVETSWIRPAKNGQVGEAFLYAGALVPYKKPGTVVEAFNRSGDPLWIVGSGPLEQKLRQSAKPNIRFFGFVPDIELAELYRRCRALIFPGIEDFGLVPIECMAAGRPVIATYNGACKETINGLRPWNNEQISSSSIHETWPFTGVFLSKGGTGHNAASRASEEVERLISSISLFKEHEHRFSSDACVNWAGQYSVDRFFQAWQGLLLSQGLAAFTGTLQPSLAA